MRNVWLSGKSMELFVNSLETKSRLTQLIAPYIASDKLLVKSKLTYLQYNGVVTRVPWEDVAQCWPIWMSRALNLLQTKGPLGASQYLVQSYRVVN